MKSNFLFILSVFLISIGTGLITNDIDQPLSALGGFIILSIGGVFLWKWL